MVKFIVRLFIVLLLTGNSVIGAEKGKEVWWDNHWEYRVNISFKNNFPVDLINQPVIITGDEFFKKTGMKDINTTSFRIIKGKEEIPIQIDERDGTGLFVKEPNYTLDKDDEIVFEVNIPKGKKEEYFLYFSKKPKPIGVYETDIKYESLANNDIGQLEMKNSELSFVVKGPRTQSDMDPKEIHYANFGCGAITSLVVKGNEMLHFTTSYGQVIPSVAVNISYSNPEVNIDGPVRKVIGMIRDNYQIKYKDERIGFEGKEIRYFSLYTKSGRIDFEDVFIYSKWDLSIWSNIIEEAKPMIKYNPNYAAGIFDLNDSLIVPIAGKIKEIDMGKVELKKEGYQTFYDTPQPEGWFLWFDKESKIGFATFFQPEFFTVRIWGINQQNSLNQPWGKPSNYLWYQIPEEVSAKKSLTVKISFFAIEDSSGIDSFYEFWKNPKMKFGFIEEEK